MDFILNNDQRKYFGLQSIGPTWDRDTVKGSKYQVNTVVFFDNNTLKKSIVSSSKFYVEQDYEAETNERKFLLPKRAGGKERKLTAATLESLTPKGVYLRVEAGNILIGNYTTQKTFYTNRWETDNPEVFNADEVIASFIRESHDGHIDEVKEFKNERRKLVKFKAGDFFAFKISRTEYGFGRVLLDVGKLKKKKYVNEKHGLSYLMGMPVLVKKYIYTSTSKDVDIDLLQIKAALPSDYMFDNKLHYGEYEIIGNKTLTEEDYDFPISYGKRLGLYEKEVFLQWGLISLSLPLSNYNKYLVNEKAPAAVSSNPHGYYSIGFDTAYDSIDIITAVSNNGFDYKICKHYKAALDLRNPENNYIKIELFNVFGLDPKKSYSENCKLLGIDPICL